MQRVLDCLVAGADLGDDEVHENDARQKHRHRPDCPVQLCLVGLQVGRSSEVKVTNRQPHYVEQSGGYLVQAHVLFVWAGGGELGSSGGSVIAVLVLPPVNNTKDECKGEQQKHVEQEERHQVDGDLPEHRHEERQGSEEPQEKEGFNQHEQGNCHHQPCVQGTQRVGTEPLRQSVGDAHPDMSLVD